MERVRGEHGSGAKEAPESADRMVHKPASAGFAVSGDHARETELGSWGGEVRSEFAPKAGEIVAMEHWCSSGFANTDLDLLLKKHGIHRLIVIGLIAHTCVEATVRFAAELGYEVTMVKDRGWGSARLSTSISQTTPALL